VLSPLSAVEYSQVARGTTNNQFNNDESIISQLERLNTKAFEEFNPNLGRETLQDFMDAPFNTNTLKPGIRGHEANLFRDIKEGTITNKRQSKSKMDNHSQLDNSHLPHRDVESALSDAKSPFS
jgi:hypothetical protein